MIYNKVFLVNSDIAVDAGFATFSLYDGDLLFTDHNSICAFIYGRDKNRLDLKKENQRVLAHIRVGNQIGWTPVSRALDIELTDITTQYKREQLLREIV